jgi:cytochrome c-type biogenesis protein CcmH
VNVGDDLDPHEARLSTRADILTRVRFLLLILVVGLSVASTTACSSTPPTDAERARAVEGQVWSPYCPGRLVIDCATRQSQELRQQISDRIARGDSTDEVLDWVRDEFGEQAVARPETSGPGLVIWLVPVAIFLFGTVLVIRVITRRNQEEIDADPKSRRDLGG